MGGDTTGPVTNSGRTPAAVLPILFASNIGVTVLSIPLSVGSAFCNRPGLVPSGRARVGDTNAR